jgi:hypothetical protein
MHGHMNVKYPIVFILLGMFKDIVYINALHNEGDMKWNAEWYIVVQWYDMSWNKNMISQWVRNTLSVTLYCRKRNQTFVKKWCQNVGNISTWICGLRWVMGPKVIVALIAHHTPTTMSCNGSGLTWESCYCPSFRTHWRETQHRRWTERVWGFSLHHQQRDGTYQYTHFYFYFTICASYSLWTSCLPRL